MSSPEPPEYIFTRLIQTLGADPETSEIVIRNNTVFYELYTHGFGDGILNKITELNNDLDATICFNQSRAHSETYLLFIVKDLSKRDVTDDEQQQLDDLF